MVKSLKKETGLLLKNHLVSQTAELFDLFTKSARSILNQNINKINNESLKKESYNLEGLLNIFTNPNKFNLFIEELYKLKKNELMDLMNFYINALDKINIDYNYILNMKHKNVEDYINETGNFTLKKILQYTWRYGDANSKEAIINYFDGNADIRFDLDPGEANGKTTRENGKKIYHISSEYRNAQMSEDLLNAAIILSHESYRRGDQRGGKKNTRDAVKADIKMVEKMVTDFGYDFLRYRPHLRFLLYLHRKFKKERFDEVVDYLYDSTADFDKTFVFAGTELFKPKREIRDLESDPDLPADQFFSFNNAVENFKNFTDININALEELADIAKIINFNGTPKLLIAPWSGSNYPTIENYFSKKKMDITGRDDEARLIAKKMKEYIKNNLNDGEKINFIGFSHGETMAVMVANELKKDYGDKFGIFIGLSGINRSEKKYQMDKNTEKRGFKLVFDIYDSYDLVRSMWAQKDTYGKKGIEKGDTNIFPEEYREHENADFINIINSENIKYPFTDYFTKKKKLFGNNALFGPQGWLDMHYQRHHEITKFTKYWRKELEQIVDWYFRHANITKGNNENEKIANRNNQKKNYNKNFTINNIIHNIQVNKTGRKKELYNKKLNFEKWVISIFNKKLKNINKYYHAMKKLSKKIILKNILINNVLNKFSNDFITEIKKEYLLIQQKSDDAAKKIDVIRKLFKTYFKKNKNIFTSSDINNQRHLIDIELENFLNIKVKKIFKNYLKNESATNKILEKDYSENLKWIIVNIIKQSSKLNYFIDRITFQGYKNSFEQSIYQVTIVEKFKIMIKEKIAELRGRAKLICIDDNKIYYDEINELIKSIEILKLSNKEIIRLQKNVKIKIKNCYKKIKENKTLTAEQINILITNTEDKIKKYFNNEFYRRFSSIEDQIEEKLEKILKE